MSNGGITGILSDNAANCNSCIGGCEQYLGESNCFIEANNVTNSI
jgi:hypothetical protein